MYLRNRTASIEENVPTAHRADTAVPFQPLFILRSEQIYLLFGNAIGEKFSTKDVFYNDHVLNSHLISSDISKEKYNTDIAALLSNEGNPRP